MVRPLLPPSVRARAALAATLVVAMALTGNGVRLTGRASRQPHDERAHHGVGAGDRHRQSASTGQLPRTVVLGGDENGIVEVIDATGRVLASSANLPRPGPIAVRQPFWHTDHNHDSRPFADRDQRDDLSSSVWRPRRAPDPLRSTWGLHSRAPTRRLPQPEWCCLSASRCGRPSCRADLAVVGRALRPVDGDPKRSRAFVEIQTGCDHRCTFCIIRFGRGNNRSVPVGEIVTPDPHPGRQRLPRDRADWGRYHRLWRRSAGAAQARPARAPNPGAGAGTRGGCVCRRSTWSRSMTSCCICSPRSSG